MLKFDGTKYVQTCIRHTIRPFTFMTFERESSHTIFAQASTLHILDLHAYLEPNFDPYFGPPGIFPIKINQTTLKCVKIS